MSIIQPDVETIATENNMMSRVLSAPTSIHCTEELHHSVAPSCDGTWYCRAQPISVWLSGLRTQYDKAVITSVMDPKTPKLSFLICVYSDLLAVISTREWLNMKNIIAYRMEILYLDTWVIHPSTQRMRAKLRGTLDQTLSVTHWFPLGITLFAFSDYFLLFSAKLDILTLSESSFKLDVIN